MEVKKIIELLSQTEDIKYSTILFESSKEKNLVTGAIITYVVFLVAQSLGYQYLTLFSIILNIIFLVSYSVISLIRDRRFILNPISYYAEQLNESLTFESELISQLSSHSAMNIQKTKQIFERESGRINEKIAFLVGASEKVGLFPSFLAAAYAFYEFTPEEGISIFSALLVGISTGLYLGVLLLKRITNWQKECIYLLDDALKLRAMNSE